MNPSKPDKNKFTFWDEKDLDEHYRNPKNWKWGMFYHNKADERLFVPKPNPNHGSTVNFAHKLAILAFSAPLFFIIILIVVVLTSF